MRLAQSIGIDGFALDIGEHPAVLIFNCVLNLIITIGTDPYNAQQLGYAYAAAEALNFKVFLSFDFSHWTSDGKHPYTVSAATSKAIH